METNSLVLILDGFRSDYITPDLSPTLCALANNGVRTDRHHAVFPSKTRVQSATIASGVPPHKHGIVDNILHRPTVSSDPLTAKFPKNIRLIERESDRGLYPNPTLGELLEEHNRQFFAAGACSPGTNYLLNHSEAGQGIYNANGFITPSGQTETVQETLGEFPESGRPNVDQNQWVLDAFRSFALGGDQQPAVSILWLSEPDKSGHEHPVGHQKLKEAVRGVDDQVGRLLTDLEEQNIRDKTDVFVLADHGFSTDVGSLDVETRIENLDLSTNATVVGYHVYFDSSEESILEETSRSLQADPEIGAVFADTEQLDLESNPIPRTFPRALVNLDHPHAGDLIVAPRWTTEVNECGYPGLTARSRYTGSHGTLSPYEMQVTMIANGPTVKSGGEKLDTVTNHIDIAPLLLHLQGIQPPDTMDGRIPFELLENGPDSFPGSIELKSAPTEKSYELGLETARVNGIRFPLHLREDETKPPLR